MIKDKSIRDRFCQLDLDDSIKEKEYKDKLDNFNFLLIKVRTTLRSIDNSLKEAREHRKQLNIYDGFSIIESLDKKINDLSNKKILLSKKVDEIEEYIKREKENNEKEC